MSQTIVRRSFETRVAAWAAALTPAMPIAYENSPFTPPASAARYGRCYVLPGNTDSRDLAGKHREFVGVFQLSLVLPINAGTKTAADLAQSLDDAFPTGAPLVQNGFNVWIVRPMSVSPAIQEPDHYVIPVSATYKAELFLSP